MEKQGLIKLGSGRLPKDFWSMPRAEDPQGLVLKALFKRGKKEDEILGFLSHHPLVPERADV
jgi:hypothetical protein